MRGEESLAGRVAALQEAHAAAGRRLAEAERRLARLSRSGVRCGAWKRRAGASVAALLIALVPLALMAANPFTDLNNGSPHNGNIDAIFTAGITTGCDPGIAYCPNGTVTREEMASFLARAAGLGGNGPVANAKMAQQATQATTALSAKDAEMIGGRAPGALARIAHAAPTDPPAVVILSDTYRSIAAVTIAVSAAGYVLVIGTASIINGNQSGQAQVRLRDIGTGGAASPSALGTVGTGVGNAGALTFTPTYLFPIGTAGPRTFAIEGFCAPCDASATNAEIVALFIPFGTDGAAPP